MRSFEEGDVPLDRIEPSRLNYDEVQKDTYQQTLRREKKQLLEKNRERRDRAYRQNRPTLAEGAGATVLSAGIEGATAFCMKLAEKRRSGKRFRDFDAQDWRELAASSGMGTLEGGVRGLSIYLLTNCTPAPAAVASALVTAAFSVAEQAHLLRSGARDAQAFIENSEVLCIDAAVSALASLAGQVLIPVPILGSVIGNAVGTMLCRIAKELPAREQALLEGYLRELRQLDENLQAQYREFIRELSQHLRRFMAILERAFSPDIRTAFAGSVELAREMGVPAEEILDNKKKLYSYFLD